MNTYTAEIVYDTPDHEKLHIVDGVMAFGICSACETAVYDFFERTNCAEIEKIVIKKMYKE